MVQKKGKKRNRILLVLLVLILIVLVSFMKFPLASSEIPVTFIFGNHSGFDLNPEILSFGMISSSSSSSRGIVVSNDFDYPVKIIIEAKGQIRSNLIVSENDFYLDPFESREVIFSIHSFGLTEFKKYEGSVLINSYSV